MVRQGAAIELSDGEREALEKSVRGWKTEQRITQRAKIILALGEGKTGQQIALEQGVREGTVSKWRIRYAKSGIRGLSDAQRPGKPVQYGATFGKKVLETLELPPPGGQASWDGASVAKYLGTSDDAVWRFLKKEGISLSRQRRTYPVKNKIE